VFNFQTVLILVKESHFFSWRRDRKERIPGRSRGQRYPRPSSLGVFTLLRWEDLIFARR